jgi:CBS domain-containing protein
MALRVRDVMTAQPVALPASSSVQDAAATMAKYDIGDVLVTDNGRIRWIVTDRDLVVRSVARGEHPMQQTLEAICSTGDLVTVMAGDTADRAALLMRDHAVRRVPVVEGDDVVGIISLGDLAQAGNGDDAEQALEGVSAAAPTR